MQNKKVILITGASSGMGHHAALELIREGHIVYGAARRADKMQDLVQAGGHAVAMDVTDEAQIVSAVKRMLDEQGRIDVLINNAGYGLYGALEDVPMADARRQFDVNLFGLARLTKEVLPHMRGQGSGRIINMSSMGGRIYFPLGTWYHASKHALEGWSDSLRLELAPHGIHVVVIEPGAIATEFGEVMTESMVERAIGGPYAEMTRLMADVTKASYEKPNASSPPSVITRLISKAVNSARPKTRYAGGKYAKLLMGLRRWVSDRTFDRVVMGTVRNNR